MNTSKRQRRHLTPRQRLFAEALSRGRSQVNAARFAGYRPNDGYTSELARSPKITREIERLQAERRKTEELTVEWWREQVWTRYRLAAERDDESACARYLEMAGKHLGALDHQVPSTKESAFFAFLEQAASQALTSERHRLPEGHVRTGDAAVEAAP